MIDDEPASARYSATFSSGASASHDRSIPVIHRVGVGQATTTNFTLGNTFPLDFSNTPTTAGTSTLAPGQPAQRLEIRIELFQATSDGSSGRVPLEGCSFPDFPPSFTEDADRWYDRSSFVIELSAGMAINMTCTLPGAAQPGVTEYWLEVTTYSGYNMATQSAHWFVEAN